jgi:uncharacterized protein (TIGR02246 family)
MVGPVRTVDKTRYASGSPLAARLHTPNSLRTPGRHGARRGMVATRAASLAASALRLTSCLSVMEISMRMSFLSALLLAGSCMGPAADAGPADDVHNRFEQWIAAFNSNDADRIASLYDKDARLLSTGGNEKPLDGRDAIRSYFAAAFGRGANSVAFDHDDAVKMLDDAANTAIETGYYHFVLPGPGGQPDTWISRYTFVFEKKDGVWSILHHHSSKVPNMATSSATR